MKNLIVAVAVERVSDDTPQPEPADSDEASSLRAELTALRLKALRSRAKAEGAQPEQLEDAAVGRWLARITRGRAHAHVASLHAAADDDHLGAGVCHELNSLTCELIRRAGIPAGIATGWVLEGGALSEPDHLWVVVFLETEGGEPVWIPVDASATRERFSHSCAGDISTLQTKTRLSTQGLTRRARVQLACVLSALRAIHVRPKIVTLVTRRARVPTGLVTVVTDFPGLVTKT